MQPSQRATLEPEELAVVLSHFDLGVIESITPFARGSRRSPKVGVVSERGKFLLKRRASNRAHPDRVRFAHLVQGRLQGVGFPLPKLVRTRDRSQTAVQLRDHVYELFEFVPGHPYRQTVVEAGDAGAVLAKFHHATDDFVTPPSLAVPHGDFHDSGGVRTGLCSIGATLSSHDSFSGDEAELATLVQFLLGVYDQAAATANRTGYGQWPVRVIHSDWHPGNTLFRHGKVVAVIDYDSVRLSRRVIDVANGALQFSIIGRGDPASWPAELDEERFAAFLGSYESIYSLSDDERNTLPSLMCEALIAECVPPITETGSVGPWTGYGVLKMAKRKVSWMLEQAGRLASTVHDSRRSP